MENVGLKFEKNKTKKIEIKEFREQGFLQEVNRQFLHPLGLALEVSIDDTGQEFITGVWDYRDDPEGIIYDLKNSNDQRIRNFARKKELVDKERDKHITAREELLGSNIERIEY